MYRSKMIKDFDMLKYNMIKINNHKRKGKIMVERID